MPILGRRWRSVVADLVGLTRDVEGRYLRILRKREQRAEEQLVRSGRYG